MYYGAEAHWTTFPEWLEEEGISWKIYQNELSVGVGFEGEEDAWRANFEDNPIEWFTQYNVRCSEGFRGYLDKRAQTLPAEIEALHKQARSLPADGEEAKNLARQIDEKTAALNQVKQERERWSAENFEKLSEREKSLHYRAFSTNSGDPAYHELATLDRFTIRLEARNEVFEKRSAGSPFNVYAFPTAGEAVMRTYAVTAGDTLSDFWNLVAFENSRYHLRVDGPNGFYREFKGTANDPFVEIQIAYAESGKSLTGQVEMHLINQDSRRQTIEGRDNAYQMPSRKQLLPAGGKTKLVVETHASHGWYDFSIHMAEVETFAYRYAGRIETGKWSYSDPAMG